MSLAPQPQRELWSMDPTPVLQPSAVRVDPSSASRYPTAAWPSVPSSEPAPPAYKMPSPLIPSSPAPDMRPAPRSVDEDLKDLLSGFNTPAPPTQMVAPSFPTQSPAPAPQVSVPSSSSNNAVHTPYQAAPPSPQQRPQMQPVPQAPLQAQGPNLAEVTNQLATFMRRVEDNFNNVTRHLSEVERRLATVEQASKEAAEMSRTNSMEKKRMLETIQQQLTELRRQTAMATVAVRPGLLFRRHSSYSSQAPPPTPAFAPQPSLAPQPAPVYTQPMQSLTPLPSYSSQRLPPLQPANSLYMPPPSAPRKNDQEEADRLLALRLQEEINRESGPSDLLPGVDTARAHSKPTPTPTPGGPSSSEGHTECPICGMDQPISQIESHVNKHLEENPSVATAEQKEGFLSWLFSGKQKNQPQPMSRPEPPKFTPPAKPSAPVAKAQPQPQVLNLGQPGLYPSQYRYSTAVPPPGMQIPPGMQLATIPPGAPIPPGAVPLGNYPQSVYPPTQMYYSQVGQQAP